MDDVEPSGSGNLVIPIERVPVAAFQAIYHNLTRKTDFLRKRYESHFYITVDGLTDLHYHIVQTMSQYGVRSSSSRIVFSLANGEILDISSVEMFTSMNLRAFGARSQSIVVTYDYLIIRPVELTEAEDVSQRFRVKIDISPNRELIDEGFFVGVGSGAFPSRDTLRLSSEIEYSDIAISRSLQSVLSEWSGRHTAVQPGAINEEFSATVRRYTSFTAPAAAMGVFTSSIFFEFDRYNNLLTPIRYFFVVITSCIGVAIGASLAVDYINRTLRKLENKTVLNLTTGDAKYNEDEQRDRASSKSKLKYAVGTILMSVVLGLLVNFLSVFILPNG